MSLYFDIIRHISAYGGVKCQGLSPLPRLGRQVLCFKGKPVFFILRRTVLKLSGGQQQRVAIARSLASDAPVILADEPTGNLDEATAAEITEILKESAQEYGKCVIIVTHSNAVAKAADCVLEIKGGTLKVRN